jgi:hypothetical protein
MRSNDHHGILRVLAHSVLVAMATCTSCINLVCNSDHYSNNSPIHRSNLTHTNLKLSPVQCWVLMEDTISLAYSMYICAFVHSNASGYTNSSIPTVISGQPIIEMLIVQHRDVLHFHASDISGPQPLYGLS